MSSLVRRSEERRKVWHDTWMTLVREKDLGGQDGQSIYCKILDYSPKGLCAESPRFVRTGEVLESEKVNDTGLSECFIVRWVIILGGFYRFGCSLMYR